MAYPLRHSKLKKKKKKGNFSESKISIIITALSQDCVVSPRACLHSVNSSLIIETASFKQLKDVPLHTLNLGNWSVIGMRVLSGREGVSRVSGEAVT